jgi:hypothetical protein
MSTIDGTWKIEIATPMGTQRFTLDIQDEAGSLQGTATNNVGAFPLKDGQIDGDALSFSVDVTAPFPLTLLFTLTVDGDSIAGESKAGPFPPSAVTGGRA